MDIPPIDTDQLGTANLSKGTGCVFEDFRQMAIRKMSKYKKVSLLPDDFKDHIAFRIEAATWRSAKGSKHRQVLVDENKHDLTGTYKIKKGLFFTRPTTSSDDMTRAEYDVLWYVSNFVKGTSFSPAETIAGEGQNNITVLRAAGKGANRIKSDFLLYRLCSNAWNLVKNVDVSVIEINSYNRTRNLKELEYYSWLPHS